MVYIHLEFSRLNSIMTGDHCGIMLLIIVLVQNNEVTPKPLARHTVTRRTRIIDGLRIFISFSSPAPKALCDGIVTGSSLLSEKRFRRLHTIYHRKNVISLFKSNERIAFPCSICIVFRLIYILIQRKRSGSSPLVIETGNCSCHISRIISGRTHIPVKY